MSKKINTNDTEALKRLNSVISSKTATVNEAKSEFLAISALYEANAAILVKVNALNYTPKNLVSQNNYIQKYTDLRIQQMALFKNALDEGADKYTAQLTAIANQIQNLVETNKKE